MMQRLAGGFCSWWGLTGSRQRRSIAGVPQQQLPGDPGQGLCPLGFLWQSKCLQLPLGFCPPHREAASSTGSGGGGGWREVMALIRLN